jgi:hypothetical protein
MHYTLVLVNSKGESIDNSNKYDTYTEATKAAALINNSPIRYPFAIVINTWVLCACVPGSICDFCNE